MTRLFLAASMALALAACSTTGTTKQETRTEINTAYAFTSNVDGNKVKSQGKIDQIRPEPRLGFAGFSGSHTLWGAN